MRIAAPRARTSATCSLRARELPLRRRAPQAARDRQPTARRDRRLRDIAAADRRGAAQQSDRDAASRGSGTGLSVSTDHVSATSSTCAPSARAVSSVGQSGNAPSIGISAPLGLRGRRRRSRPPAAGSSNPCRSRAPARRGRRRERRRCPLEEPPVVLPGCAGLWQVPYHAFWPITLQANSGRCVLPTTTAPASTSRCTAAALCVGT